MAISFPTVGDLLGDAARLTNRLIDAAENAGLREHADHWLDAARQLWRSVCHLQEALPASEEERRDVERQCAALSQRFGALESVKRRH